jgi:hypothetical protein
MVVRAIALRKARFVRTLLSAAAYRAARAERMRAKIFT